MNNHLAQIRFSPTGGFIGFGSLGQTPVGSGINSLSMFLTATIGIVTLAAILLFVYEFITGAIGVITSGGDKNALEAAKKKITTALIGLVLMIIAIFILNLIGFFLGVPILNLCQLFNTLIPGGSAANCP
jgi:hypothetical protein